MYREHVIWNENGVAETDGWALIDDYRWLPVYNKQTRQRVGINVPGALPAELTLLAPTSQYDEWNDELGAWVENRDLKLQLAKSSLLAEIAAKRWQVEIGGISVAGITTDKDDKAVAAAKRGL